MHGLKVSNSGSESKSLSGILGAQSSPLAAATAGGKVSPLAENIESLVEADLLPFLRPAAPPGVEILMKRGPKLSDGKLPALFRDGKWFGFPNWREYTPEASDPVEWCRWPGAGICLVTGTVAAFDIDVKADAADESDQAERIRTVVRDIVHFLVHSFETELEKLPLRWRANSSSCAVFVRLGETAGKRVVAFVDAETGRQHKVEFLANGQQIIIAGIHNSGVPVRSSLARIGLDRLPLLTLSQLDSILAGIATIAERHGFKIDQKSKPARVEQAGSPTPAQRVEREILRRRDVWLPNVVPCVPGQLGSETRISSATLDRDLEEDLVVYADGIHDFGTERTHTLVSFIREFGGLDGAGNMVIGGCPEYGRRGDDPYAVVGEPDSNIRRPTEAEVIAWLHRRLAGSSASAPPAHATWSSSLPHLASAVGLDWATLEQEHDRQFFDTLESGGDDAAVITGLIDPAAIPRS